MSNKAKLSAFTRLALLPLLLFLLHGDDARTTTRAQSGAGGAASQARPEQFVMPLHGEGFIAFKIEAAPVAGAPKVSVRLDEIQASLTPQVMLADNHVVHRVLVDAEGAFVFGYDLVVEPVAASKQFKVSVKPMSAEFEEQLRARQTAAGAQRAPQNISTLPRPADAQLIDDGDAFALDLLVNPQTGVKIVDVVKVSFDRARLWSAPPRRSVPLRDFTLGNVELAMRDYKLTVNGELVGGGRGKHARGFAGALIWFYVPERGRFIFSLIPHEGYDFQKVGRIENNKISFTLGGDVYEWTSSAPVVGASGGNWNLWVLHDAAYVSDFDSQEQIVAGAEVNSPPAAGNGASSPEWMRDSLERIRRERRAEFEARVDSRKRAERRRPRVLAGGADRIENLLPKR
ncbi:MAG: hypothetical protein QOD32_3430 [Pyrinomonadaceae bacterium]|nr:hypothetical protein [Pyrinomonadaceae bacterium]